MLRITGVLAGLSLAVFGNSAAFAETINVPDDQPTIAAAISASVNGDVIAIAAGRYYEFNLNTDGKAITIQGTVNGGGGLGTTIDAQQGQRVFGIASGEGPDTVIKDLIFTAGGNIDAEEGGIIIVDSSPTISGCWIKGNTAIYGGGIYCKSSNPTISDCRIEGNTANYGGGIYCNNSNPTISGCTITGNTANGYGGGLLFDNSNPTITDSLICGNEPDQIDGDWSDNGGNCITDSCEDTDDNGVPDGCEACVGDVNGDGQVNGFDLGLLLAAWTGSNDCDSESCLAADFNGDGRVDGFDMGLFLSAWGNDCTGG